MGAAKRLQTIHVKDEQGRIVSSWQRVRVAVPDGISASLPPPYTGLKHLTKKVQTEAEYAETKARFLAVMAGAASGPPFIANLATSIGWALTSSCDAARHPIVCSQDSSKSKTRFLANPSGRSIRRPSQSSRAGRRGCRPNAKWGCARGPSAGGLDCTDWNRRSG